MKSNDGAKQKTMLAQAEERHFQQNAMFLDIMGSDNPLTADEIENLADRFPERWERFRKYAQGMREGTVVFLKGWER